MELYPHQTQILAETEKLNKVAYYLDMGLGKTFVGSEKMNRLGNDCNLVICQKSKVNDWLCHFWEYYKGYKIYNLTIINEIRDFLSETDKKIGVINYDLFWRRPELHKLQGFTLMLDESSLIQNERTKRAKSILKLKPENVILLSGTPTGGKYENLWSQLRLLGWDITKTHYTDEFVIIQKIDMGGITIPIVKGYKRVERLKRKMYEYGCRFLKTEEVLNLPEQTFIDVKTEVPNAYRRFKKDKIIEINGTQLLGDTTLTEMLGYRKICGMYNENKLTAFKSLLESTNGRLIVFYNFFAELQKMKEIAESLNKPVSIVNGARRDLTAYETKDDSITFVQYQAGAMGLNLQKADKIIYYTPTLSSELYEQSKKRIHRIGQKNTCFYYRLMCPGTIEESIYKTLEKRQDYTEKLFLKGDPKK